MTVTTLAPTEFGGYPYLDDSFTPGRLLAAVACTRQARAGRGDSPNLAGFPVARYLDPSIAAAVRRLDINMTVEWAELDGEAVAMVDEAVDLVGRVVPAWKSLMSLPVVFGAAPPSWGCVSASAFAWPQQIWLADTAFATTAGLAEQVVHEMSHQWMYLLEELSPLYDETVGTRFTLPSGTSDRSPGELLGATHVSLTLRVLWRALDVPDDVRGRRLDHLETYIDGCCQLMTGMEHVLTDEGRALAARLKAGVTT